LTVPRVVIAAPQGRSGKTTVCAGLCAALAGRGLTVQPFKKGPDYIDPSWLSAAAGRSCRNLDLFMMSREAVLGSFHRATAGVELAVIEGAMGLYDGLDVVGSGSTAQLARVLGAPVILVVNVTRMTRSVAALVSGYQHFEPDINLAGVILNNVATGRHESMLIHAITRYCQIPVLGCLPKAERATISERHLGLVPEGEADSLVEKVTKARELIESCVDIDAVVRVAQSAGALTPPAQGPVSQPQRLVRLGVIRDRAFSFYYPDNLEALEGAGAELVYINALEDPHLPAVSGLYIGGGFPEVFAEQLQANAQLRREIAVAIDEGLPVYAECAGLLYLARRLLWEGRTYEMVGALPVDVSFGTRPQGHGYVVSQVVGENPFFDVGQRLIGHEFHHGRLENADELPTAYRLERGQGIGQKRDGIVHKNVLAGFTHLHALSEPTWGERVVDPTRSAETGRQVMASRGPSSAAR
jgi:cobyrinic acid a,c-diamide synthase